MKRALLGVLGVIGVVIVGLLVAASMQPGHIHLDRSVRVLATAADMAPFANDLAQVNRWSPWEEKDPNSEKHYSNPSDGEGAWYTWSGNDEVGEGKMTIISIAPTETIHKLEFFAPFEGVARASIAYTQDGDHLNVVWGFDQDADLSLKIATLFMNLEDQLGPDFERGLTLLKPLVEGAATAREEAEADEAARVAEEEAAALVQLDGEMIEEPEDEANPTE